MIDLLLKYQRSLQVSRALQPACNIDQLSSRHYRPSFINSSISDMMYADQHFH